MQLAEFIEAEGLTLAEFGSKIGRSAATVSRIARGIHKPDWATIAAINDATSGQVSPNDFLDCEAAT